MQCQPRVDLNDSGEMLFTRIVSGGAVHVSRGERTHAHAHYAWKVVVGLDAPVWCAQAGAITTQIGDSRAIVIPPGLVHEVGGSGWTCTVFSAPGRRNTPWHTGTTAWVPDPAVVRRVVAVCRHLVHQERPATAGQLDEVFALVFSETPSPSVDVRVRKALRRLGDPEPDLVALARSQRLSLDRLSHLVKHDTGLPLRKHVVWSRLMGLLSEGTRYESIASAAAAAGFSDHAHLTRTYRSYLGRLPSDFSGPPDVLQRW